MNTTLDQSTYQSPFTWRYGSNDMRDVFSELHKYKLWRRIWVALAKAEYQAGLVNKKELNDLISHEEEIDIDRILEIEKETRHDVVAAIREFSEKAVIGGGKIHTGATSMDVVDNADALRTREALSIIRERLARVLAISSDLSIRFASLACMGFTHLQPAEPTTVGYRFSVYLHDYYIDWQLLVFVLSIYKAKGMKGAVGTRASYKEVLKQTKITAQKLDELVMDELGLESVEIATQVVTRKFDYLTLTLLSSLSATCAKFAGDLRILQSSPFGEWSESFGSKQVGSSAMPFKKNPINAENICSLARFVNQLPAIALENATLSYLERTLDDSANKRIIMAEAFLAVDEILMRTAKLMNSLVINKEKIAFTIDQYAPFAATESILMILVKKGEDRQSMHELIRTFALEAQEQVAKGKPNPLKQLIASHPIITKHISRKMLDTCFDVTGYVGDAPARAEQFGKRIQKELKKTALTGVAKY